MQRSQESLERTAQVLPKLKQKTKAVVYWGSGEPSEADRKALKSAKVPLHSFPDFEKLGRDKPKDPIPPSPQDPCTIMYTRWGSCHGQFDKLVVISRLMTVLNTPASIRPASATWGGSQTCYCRRCDSHYGTTPAAGMCAVQRLCRPDANACSCHLCARMQRDDGRTQGCGGDAHKHRDAAA